MAGQSQSYRDRATKNKSRFYFLIGVVLIVAAIKWGIPFFINFLAGTGERPKISTSDDTIAPQTPTLDPVAEATNSARVKLHGYTEAEAEVTILNNGEEKTKLSAANDGAFEYTMSIEEGENEIVLTAKDKAGNESQSRRIVVAYDNKKPELTIESPTDGSQFFGRDKQNIDLKGKIDEGGVELTVNGSYVRVGSDGTFNQKLRLNEGENQLVFVVVDKAGNKTEKTIKTNFSL